MPRCRHDHIRASHKEAWCLAERGYKVTLVCKQPDVSEYLGMRVVPANAPAEGFLRPITNTPKLLRQARQLDSDIYVLINPDTLVLGILLVLCGKRVVYSCYEDYIDKVRIHPLVPKPAALLIGSAIAFIEAMLVWLTALTIVTQPSVKRRFGQSALLVGNAPLTSGPIFQKTKVAFSRLDKSELPTIIYSGAITLDRGLYRMLDLIGELNRIQPWSMEFVGYFTNPDDLRLAQKHPQWRHVKFAGEVSHAESMARIRNADIGLALLDDVAGYRKTSITKLYEYMLFETPFVASNFTHWRRTVDGADAGIFCDTVSSRQLALQIDELFSNRDTYESMQKRGREFIEQNFNWHKESRPMQESISSLIGPVEVHQ